MLFVIVALTLFAALMAADADAETATATELIKKCCQLIFIT